MKKVEGRAVFFRSKEGQAFLQESTRQCGPGRDREGLLLPSSSGTGQKNLQTQHMTATPRHPGFQDTSVSHPFLNWPRSEAGPDCRLGSLPTPSRAATPVLKETGVPRTRKLGGNACWAPGPGGAHLHLLRVLQPRQVLLFLVLEADFVHFLCFEF